MKCLYPSQTPWVLVKHYFVHVDIWTGDRPDRLKQTLCKIMYRDASIPTSHSLWFPLKASLSLSLFHLLLRNTQAYSYDRTHCEKGRPDRTLCDKERRQFCLTYFWTEWVSLALPINQNSNSHAHCTYCNSLGFMLHQNELRTQLESKNLKPQTSSSTNYILQYVYVVYEDNTITTVRNERGLFTLRKMGENAIHNKCQTLSNNTRTNNDEPNLSQSPLSSCKTLFCIRR